MTWLAPHDGSPGRPAVFSDAAIQFCLTIKVLFKLPLRQATGMVSSLLEMANLDWAVPDYATLCRRQKTLAVQIPNRRADEPLNLLVDSTGIRFLGDGEWQARKHGVQGRRQGRKVHLAMATATSDIRAVEFTPSSDGPSHGLQANHCRAVESPVLPELLDQIPEDEEIGSVTAPSRQMASQSPAGQWMAPMTAVAVIPQSSTDMPRRSSPSARTADPGRKTVRRQSPQQHPARHPALRQGVPETLDRIPRPQPDRGEDTLAGSLEPLARNLLDLKAFGERIAASDPDRQTAEIQIRVALINRFNALGIAEIIRVA